MVAVVLGSHLQSTVPLNLTFNPVLNAKRQNTEKTFLLLSPQPFSSNVGAKLKGGLSQHPLSPLPRTGPVGVPPPHYRSERGGGRGMDRPGTAVITRFVGLIAPQVWREGRDTPCSFSHLILYNNGGGGRGGGGTFIEIW